MTAFSVCHDENSKKACHSELCFGIYNKKMLKRVQHDGFAIQGDGFAERTLSEVSSIIANKKNVSFRTRFGIRKNADAETSSA